jgi:hypothetical protein
MYIPNIYNCQQKRSNGHGVAVIGMNQQEIRFQQVRKSRMNHQLFMENDGLPCYDLIRPDAFEGIQ